MQVTFGNALVTLKGTEVELGTQAPNVTLINNNLQPVQLYDFPAHYLVLSVVPSLDTGVCDRQTRTFNEKLARFKHVQVLTISTDLPFAQKRWCANAGLDNILTLSDHKDLQFAMHYGTLIESFRLHARAVFILDKERKIIYKEYVENVSNHPSYEAVLELIEEVTK